MTQPVSSPTPTSSTDVENNKWYAALAYFLFFVPLLVVKDSKFAMYHANQGLVLFIFALIINTVGTLIPLLGWFIILPLGNLFLFVLAIIGIVNALNGHEKKLPLLGGITILK